MGDGAVGGLRLRVGGVEVLARSVRLEDVTMARFAWLMVMGWRLFGWRRSAEVDGVNRWKKHWSETHSSCR